jgi:hypothetical protein
MKKVYRDRGIEGQRDKVTEGHNEKLAGGFSFITLSLFVPERERWLLR